MRHEVSVVGRCSRKDHRGGDICCHPASISGKEEIWRLHQNLSTLRSDGEGTGAEKSERGVA